MHLALDERDERIDQVAACFLLPYEAQGVPVYLQRTCRTKTILSLSQIVWKAERELGGQ